MAESHYVAVRPDRDPQLVRRLECFTATVSIYWFSSKGKTLDGWTRLALVSFRSVALDCEVQVLSLLLDFLSLLLTV